MPQFNTAKAKIHNINRETKEKGNYSQMWIRKIQKQVDREADQWNIKERHNSRKL